jgi:hypothetical protein
MNNLKQTESIFFANPGIKIEVIDFGQVWIHTGVERGEKSLR